jgi:hypothetical protein
MAKESTEGGHARAWVLVVVEEGKDPRKVAKVICALNKATKPDGEKLLPLGTCVVRADTIKASTICDIVVPVSAQTKGNLNSAVSEIEKVLGVAKAEPLMVDKHGCPGNPEDPCKKPDPWGQNAWG